MRQLFIFVLLFTLIVAEEFKDKSTLDDDKAVETGRKRFIKKFLPFGILGLGGLNFFSWFLAIKLKILFIIIIIAGGIFIGSKVALGKSILGDTFGGIGSLIHDPSPVFDSLPYHSASSVEYSSYPGGDLGGGTYLDHPPTGYSSQHSSYPGASVYGEGYSASQTAISAEGPPYPTATDVAQRRIIKTRSISDSENGRDVNDTEEDDEIDLADITFAVLGVQKKACKRRFVCEFDFRSHQNPVLRLAYTFIRNGMFPKYTTLKDLGVQHFKDCGKLFPTCKAPGEVDEEDTIEPEATTESNEQTEETGTEVVEEAAENEISKKSQARLEPIGQLLWRRMGTLSKLF